MSANTVSVVVLSYNHEAYIAQALDSVLAQQFDGTLEIIVTEDCSTDGTRAILQTYQSRYPETIRIFARDKNVGGKRNLLDGFAAATGDYIAVLDGDDYWTDPQKIASQLALLTQQPDYAAVGHNTLLHDMQGRGPDRPIVPEQRKRDRYTIRDLILGRVYLHSSSLLFRNLYKGGLPEMYGDVRVGDSFMAMLFATQGDIGFIDRIMSTYRYTGRGIWSSVNPLTQRMATLESLVAGRDKLGKAYTPLFDRALVRYSASLAFAILRSEPQRAGLLLRSCLLALGHFPGMLHVDLPWLSRCIDHFVLAHSESVREPLPFGT